MLNLEQLYPELRDSVQNRRECASLRGLSPGDLSDLVIQLVKKVEDSSSVDKMVRLARKKHFEYLDAMESSRETRGRLLGRVLEEFNDVIPVLMSSVPHFDWSDEKRSPRCEHYDFIQGYCLLSGRKLKGGNRADSYWLVTIEMESTSMPVNYRCAVMKHKRVNSGVRHELTLATAEEVGARIRDYQFKDVVDGLLRSVAVLSTQDQQTKSLFEMEQKLQGVLSGLDG